MITLIEGGFFAGCHELIKERIKELCEKKKSSLLIVPEQQTVNAEGEMADYLSPSAPLYFEVTNFTRFANTIFRAEGGLSKESADSAKRSLIMWKTLTELYPVLESVGSRAEVSSGSVTRMMGALGQMQSYGITPADLADAADKLSESEESALDTRLPAKMRDMSKIMTLYKTILGEHFSDSDDILFLAERKIADAEKDFLKDTEIFIDGFASFTEPQYRILGKLAKKCNITLNLTIPKASPDAFEFTEIKGTHKKLVKLASDMDIDVRLERMDGRLGVSSALITEIASLLWRSGVKVDTDALKEEDSFRIYEAENPYEECDFVAQDIKRRVMAGAKYSDFGIIARRIESFFGILDVSFDKAEIPLFMSKRTDISSYEVIKLIYSAFAVISGGFSRADVISYAKCSLCGVDRSIADRFELYVEKWQINGKRFTDGVIWNMNPAGYTERRREGDEAKLLEIDKARTAIISPLITLAESLEEAKTVKDCATALVDFLTALKIERKLKAKAKEELVLRGSEAARDMEKIFGVICDALDGLCEVLGDTNVSTDTFLNLLKITFSETSIGKIPSVKEQVTAGSADIARMHGKKYIYIIGANAGAFPLSVDDDSYFTDKDKRALSLLGLPIEADTDTRSARELYYFTRAISFARSGVYVLYSSSDTSFKSYAPSEAVTRICELTEKRISPIKLSSLPQRDKVYSAEYATEHLSKKDKEYEALRYAIEGAGLGRSLAVSDKPIKNTNIRLSEESLKMLYKDTVPMTQSKLELYAKCPMSYFCTYNLSLKPTERAEFDARNIGNFLHAVLESFFRELKIREKRIADITEAEKQSLILRVSTEYIKKCFEGIPETSARLKDTVNKLCRAAKPIIDGLCDEFSDCKYEPVFFELEIDKNHDGKPTPIVFNTGSGKDVYITGKIDRVDTYEKDGDVYIRVIDYKSGRKVFSPKDLEEGLNLQMFLYLKAVVETDRREFLDEVGVKDGGKMIPAGVLYVKTGIEDAKISRNNEAEALSAVKESQGRLGMLLDDSASINAMNPEYIPIKFKKDGSPDSRSEAKLYTMSGWDRINGIIEKSVTDIADRIISGDIDALPLAKKGGKSDACTYCSFKAICRNAN